MSFLECERCGGIPGVTACCSDAKRAPLSVAEPVAWLIEWVDARDTTWVDTDANQLRAIDKAKRTKGTCSPLYRAPPAPAVATVPLSDEQIALLLCDHTGLRINLRAYDVREMIDLARAIEAAHGITAKES